MTILTSTPCARAGHCSSHRRCLRLPYTVMNMPPCALVLHAWRTFTLSAPLQPSLRLLRRLRPPHRPLACSRPPGGGNAVREFPSSNTRDVLATRSCLLYAGRSRDNTTGTRDPVAHRRAFWLECITHFHSFTVTAPQVQVPFVSLDGRTGWSAACGWPLPSICPQAPDPGRCRLPTPAA